MPSFPCICDVLILFKLMEKEKEFMHSVPCYVKLSVSSSQLCLIPLVLDFSSLFHPANKGQASCIVDKQ